MAVQNSTQNESSNRVDIIQTVRTPLGFFTLVVLVVEVILGVTANFSQGTDRTYLIVGMLFLIFLLVIIVAGFGFFRPEALRGERVDSLRQDGVSAGTSLSSAVETFDLLSDQIEATITNKPLPPGTIPHGYLIKRIGNEMVAYRRVQTISFDQFDKLPKDVKRHIETYEKSMQRLYEEWESIKRTQAISQLDPQVRDKQLNLIRAMKSDLVGIIDVLRMIGFYLDDHYIYVRDLIQQLN